MEKDRFNCRKCGVVIGEHNQYLHDGMCDDCFFGTYFPMEVEIFEISTSKLKEICRHKEKENMEFRNFIKNTDFDKKKFNQIVKGVESQIDCTECGNCCKILSFALTEADMRGISERLQITEEEFRGRYTVKNNEGAYEFKQKPCIFLKNGKCRIYDARPGECRNYPHLNKDLSVRTLQFLSNAEVCPVVFNVLENAKRIIWHTKDHEHPENQEDVIKGFGGLEND